MFGISTFFVIRDIYRSKKENAANVAISSMVNDLKNEVRRPGSKTTPSTDGGEETGDESEAEDIYTEDGILKYLAPLYEQNSDLAGWLTIPGTTIDYPVMYTPFYIEKYLRMAFDGEWALSGSLFIGEGWDEDNNIAIIYGHHMQDGSMFCNLVDYESEEFAKEHPTIQFDTLRETGDYKVLCAVLSRVTSDPSVFPYSKYTDLRDPEIFAEFFERVRAEALYDTGVEVEYGDRVLVLSTCNYHTTNGRFYVVAILKADSAADSDEETPS
ncbi:MAG: class B sortase [Clostridia bacterium]|nr:class B sortase [Clostridia bacterium]